ncbi:FAD-dependent oxidoreductase [Caballeronia sp. ATUFL_M1_KS5A]|uniref:NAD(P)/FAD-dependent oxidoreductase n=1 Tax=Caballeronia sp. ATUFL_M1_KS5A TaxID=2921778 RepID=UPI0020278A54|nr:FAD-dependent oxidoreductase [Caballeronia sp. ATUFL_M1_KS5A]
MQDFDAIVIGQGYAGLMASKLAAERGLRVANIEQMFAGGLVMTVTELDPAPPGDEHSGPELTANLAMSNMDRGIESVNDTVESVSRRFDQSWIVKTGSGEYTASNVIVATGATLRKLGVKGEEEFVGRGVSTCADCDGPLYQDREVVVVGGGDSAYQEALALTMYASKVTIVIRGAAARARAEFVERAASEPKIVTLTHTAVTEIVGDAEGVTAIRVSTEGSEATLDTAGVFVFVGLESSNAFLPDDIARDAEGAIVVDARGQTTLPGVWAIGAVRSGFGGLLTHAQADAERAVLGLS